jgi:hypothetical protein
VVSDVAVDDEATVVTSRISRFAGAQSFGGAHRGRVWIRVFVRVSVRAYCERLRCLCQSQQKKNFVRTGQEQFVREKIFMLVHFGSEIGVLRNKLFCREKILPAETCRKGHYDSDLLYTWGVLVP